MKFEREQWTPLTIVIETPEEAEVLHKILGSVVDQTEERDAPTSLFFALGKGLPSEGKYRVSGSVELKDR